MIRYLLLALLAFSSTLSFGARQALVIGNDSYASVAPLKKARADAQLMAEVLRESGFQVTLAMDQRRDQMNAAVRKFKAGLAGGDEVVFYYAGHGVQLGGTNLMLPVDIVDSDEEQVRDDAIQLQRVLDDIAEKNPRFTLAIIDACRDNPFKTHTRNLGTRGLAMVSGAKGQMIVFSAGVNQKALDNNGNEESANGLFTGIFADEMRKPGAEVHQVARAVRKRVQSIASNVGHEQTPAVYDQTIGDFHFTPVGSKHAGPIVEPQSPQGPRARFDVEEEHLWAAMSKTDRISEIDGYLSRFPSGRHAEDARAKRKALLIKEDREAWTSAEGMANSGSTDLMIVTYRGYLKGFPNGIYSVLARARLNELGAPYDPAPGVPYQDCSICPTMVVIPAGTLVVNLGASGDGKVKDKTVVIQKFAIGQTEITQFEWESVMGKDFRVKDDCYLCPVGDVSWDDAQAFVRKLNSASGQSYRLPSEAEWVYACNGNEAFEYCGSNDADEVAWTGSNSGGRTHNAGEKKANAFGLHDMSGNALEWTADCWNRAFDQVPSNGSPQRTGDCDERVLRGGSALWGKQQSRSRYRDSDDHDGRKIPYGFRIAVSVPEHVKGSELSDRR